MASTNPPPLPIPSAMESVLHINVNNLTFRYQADQRPILNNLNMQLTDGARCLLIGANGAGKNIFIVLMTLIHSSSSFPSSLQANPHY